MVKRKKKRYYLSERTLYRDKKTGRFTSYSKAKTKNLIKTSFLIWRDRKTKRYVKPPKKKYTNVNKNDFKKYKKYLEKKKFVHKYFKKGSREEVLTAEYELKSAKKTKEYLDKRNKEASKEKKYPIKDKIKKYLKSRLRWDIRLIRYYVDDNGEIIDESPEMWYPSENVFRLDGYHKLDSMIKQSGLDNIVRKARELLLSNNILNLRTRWVLDLDEATYTVYHPATTKLYKRKFFHPVKELKL